MVGHISSDSGSDPKHQLDHWLVNDVLIKYFCVSIEKWFIFVLNTNQKKSTRT
jgi:hypothetical protein